MIKGLRNKIEEITVVGDGAKLESEVVGKISWSPVPGLVYIDVPANVSDKYNNCVESKISA
jgi:alpha-L-fucosidase